VYVSERERVCVCMYQCAARFVARFEASWCVCVGNKNNGGYNAFCSCAFSERGGGGRGGGGSGDARVSFERRALAVWMEYLLAAQALRTPARATLSTNGKTEVKK
jgi:hypothetical protein